MTSNQQDGGRYSADVEAILASASFAPLAASGAPLLIAAGSPARVISANDAALALFAAETPDALTSRVFGGTEPGARRLAELSRALLPGAAPRLERLRFFFGPVAEQVTMLCQRVAGASGPLFVMALLGVRPNLLRPATPPVPPALRVVEAPVEAAPPAVPHLPEALAPVAPGPAPAAPAKPARLSFEAAREELQRRHGAASPVRFLWRTDAEDRIVEITPPLTDITGERPEDLVGQHFNDVSARLGLDPEGRLAAAMARRDTWSGVEVLWPLAHAEAAVPVGLGALPAFGRERQFDGYRGFGVLHVARLTPHLRAEESAPAEIIERTNVIEDAAPEPLAPVAVVEAPAAPPTPAVEMPAAPEAEAIDAFGPESEAPAEVIVVEAPVYESDLAEELPEPVVAEPVAAEPTRAHANANVVPLRPAVEPPPVPSAPQPKPVRPTQKLTIELSPSERNAFREIARALGAKLETATPSEASDGADEAAKSPAAAPTQPVAPAAPKSGDARDLLILASQAAQAMDQPQKPAVASQPLDETKPVAPAAAEQAAPAPAAATAALPPALSGLEGPARTLLDKMPNGVLVSRDGTPIFANKKLLDLLGYADEDEFHAMGGLERMFKGRKPDMLTAPGADASIPLLTRGGDVVSVEAHMQTLDWGGLPATLMTLRPTQEAELAPHVRSLEMELRKAEADARELHAILDTATDGVAVLDSAGRILALNRSAEALFGYDQNEVTGEPFTVLIAKDSQLAAGDYLDGLKSNGVASVLNDGREIVGRARQGGAIPMFMTLGRIGAGDSSKFCAVLRDLTQWKKAERELHEARAQAERASALKSDFLAKISHEIRTPLNAILGFAEVIMEERFGPVGNDRYKDYLKDIHASGSHVMSLVNDLLDLSKIEAGKMDLNFGSVDANRIVSECVSLMQPQAARERVIVRLSLAPRLPNIVADERSLRQIVLNLLSNAVKFNEPGGQVIVSSALTDAGHAVIRIRDTGIGMSDTEVETALEPFRQIATSRQTSGTGLGLPLTKALVEANRASFTIKSKKREGTLVEVAFPPTRVLAE